VPVEAEERVLDHVFGGVPVAEHDDGQPDQAGRVRFVQRGHAGLGVGRRGRSVRFSDSCVHGVHRAETPPAAPGCLAEAGNPDHCRPTADEVTGTPIELSVDYLT
jgi:hypothetical protein